MYPSVAAAWVPINKQLEGFLTFLYLDTLGYVTTGMGDLCDPVASALALPWVQHDGTPATAAQVTAAWAAVDACRTAPKGTLQPSGLATQYGQAFAPITSIRLTDDGVAQTILKQVARNEVELRKAFPAYDTMPADGQFAVLSMAWAMGSGFPATFKQFTAAVNAGDWDTAKAQSPFKGSGVQHRIDMDTQLLANASRVTAAGSNPSRLWYPGVAP
jgi:GH24 family phage-related lysozyme (muramidase)